MLTHKRQLETYLKECIADDLSIVLSRPEKSEYGDYASNIAFLLSKKEKKSPLVIAQELANALSDKLPDYLEKVEAVAPGFLNFSIKKEYIIETVNDFIEKGLSFEKNGKEVVIEYSSPNIAKPFTIGHLRSTIIGDAIANLLQVTGWTVHRDNHVGDWGTQFGKQIYAIKNIPLDQEFEETDIGSKNEAFLDQNKRPVQSLVQLYVRFHEEAEKNPKLEEEGRKWFKKLEEGDSEAKRLWQKCIDWSWKEFDAIYKELGVPSWKDTEFENNGRGFGEAFFESKMLPVIEELKQKGLLHEGKEGAQIVEFDEVTKLPPLMILKKDGATLYATRDLATDKFRLFEKYGQDSVIINEVGAEQSLYFQQLYTLEEMLGWVKKGQRVHIKHGLYRFKEGKMSTRKGNVIWLEEVLLEAEKRALMLGESNEESPMKVAIGALKWNDLKRNPEQDIAFDWDDVLNMQGNSGPYMQYVYVRTQSVLRKAGSKDEKHQLSTTDYQLKDEEVQLLTLLSRFDEVVLEASEKFSPSILTTYLFELAQLFNLFYQKHPILKQEQGTTEFRLALTVAVGKVIKEGLQLLGIQTPEKM